MADDLQLFRDKWAESVAVNSEARERFGAETFSRTVEANDRKEWEARWTTRLAKLLGRATPPTGALPDESTALFEQVKVIRGEAKDIAADYCTANAADLTRFQGLEREHLVNLISIARTQGNADEATIIDMWLLANFEPQIIRGNFRQPAPGTGRR